MIPRQDDKAKAGSSAAWAIGSKHLITPEGVREGAVVIQGEKIVAVVTPDRLPAGYPYEDVGERVVMPGLVDAHVHINEPGRTEWEGFATATRAAAAGGFTTLVDMPLNSSPVTTTVANLARKRDAAAGQLWVDCGFYGGVVPGNADHLELLAKAGVLGFKAFLSPSGIDEFPNVTPDDLREAMPRIAATGLPLLVHAELLDGDSPAPGLPSPGQTEDPRSYARYLASRPRHWEHDAIELLINLAKEFQVPVHIVHLSSADALPTDRPGPCRWRAVDCGDLSALPLLCSRGHSRLRYTFQMCAAHSGKGEPRAPQRRAARGLDRHHRLRPFARSTIAEAPGHRQLAIGLGRHRFLAAYPLYCLDNGASMAGRVVS